MSNPDADIHRQPGSSHPPGVYRRRRPERTVVYQVVQQDLETWLATRREADPDHDPIPHYVEQDLRRYLSCGILAHDLARAYCDQCGHDFLIAFSCKGRGLCPSCNSRWMAETAAHLVDHVFPCVPVRQWVISVPKRLRYFLLHDAELASQVLRMILSIIEQSLREHSPGAPAQARTGGVSYIHRFGSALNAHLHYHSCLIDGVFAETDQGIQFFEASALTDEAVKRIQEAIRKRLLRLFVRKGLLDKAVAEQMLQWSHGGGFSLDAKVRIDAFDRQALERLLRYGAPPVRLRASRVAERG